MSADATPETQEVPQAPKKDRTIIKMLGLSVCFFGGIIVMTMVPEDFKGMVTSAVVLGVVWSLFKL